MNFSVRDRVYFEHMSSIDSGLIREIQIRPEAIYYHIEGLTFREPEISHNALEILTRIQQKVIDHCSHELQSLAEKYKRLMEDDNI